MLLLRFSWPIDNRAEVESEASLELGALWNRRRRGELGSEVIIEDDESRIRRQGLKYDCRMRKSEEGLGGGCFERLRNDFFFPGVLEAPITISALLERLCRW